MTNRLALATLGLVAVLTTMGAGQGSGLEPLLAELRNPSARARTNALERLGELGRPDAAVPIAAMLADGNDGVKGAAINALLSLYTVRTDLASAAMGTRKRRQVGDGVGDRFRGGPAGHDAGGRSGTGADGAFRPSCGRTAR